ncbi:MAG: hypothetical protein ACYC5N_07290 [Endomicrobiales bacterium]
MDNAELAGKLTYIAQINHDMIRSYDEALRKIDKSDIGVRENFVLFRNDHRRHVKTIAEAIETLGEKPPRFTENTREYLNATLSSPSNVSGTQEVLKIMQRNEYFSIKAYSEAIAEEFYTTYPLNVQVLLQRNYRDEMRHQVFIDSRLGQPVEVR